MELKLNIYTDKKCKVVEQTLIANDFELSTGVCEDILALMKVDQLEELSALSEESRTEALLEIITNNIGQFKELLKYVYDGLTDDMLARTKINDVMSVVAQITRYAFAVLFSAFKSDKKNG